MKTQKLKRTKPSFPVKPGKKKKKDHMYNFEIRRSKAIQKSQVCRIAKVSIARGKRRYLDTDTLASKIPYRSL